jgi:hypothetical protein
MNTSHVGFRVSTPLRAAFSSFAAFATLTVAFCWLIAGAATASAQPPPDLLPTIIITEPAPNALGQPDLRVRASCVDDGPTCLLRVGSDSVQWLAAGEGSIDAVIRPPDGVVRLRFTATDSANQSSEVFRTVIVNSSTRQRPVVTLPGTILDIDAARALVYDDTVSPFVLRLVDRATNASEVIWTVSTPFVQIISGGLIPGGALFAESGTPAHLREWRLGAVTDLGTIAGLPVTQGQWAVYEEFTPTGPHSGTRTLVLRDVLTGTRTVLASAFAHDGYDVTSSGRVAYSADPLSPTGAPRPRIWMYDPGPPAATTPLTAESSFQNRYPVTDGGNVVYTRTLDPIGPQISSIVLRQADGVEVVLADFPYALPAGSKAYRIAAGFVAFLKPVSGGGAAQLWIRSPDGSLQLLATAGGIEIQALTETGEVIFDSSTVLPGGTLTKQRHVGGAGGTVIPLGEALGTAVRIDGAWYTAAGPHLLLMDPTVASRAILAEGATGTFFSTDVALLNPHDAPVVATIRYLREGAPEIEELRALPARSRKTIHLDEIPGLEGTSVSTVVESPAQLPIVAERLMTWDATGYGAHLGTAVDQPRGRWYFAEGAQGFFHTFFLIANSSDREANVTFTFLLEQGTPVTRTIAVPARSRQTLHAGDVAALINMSFATIIDADVPVVAERAMYFGETPLWLGGHGSAGVPEPATQWFHAEGATGTLFDTFILLANPHPVDVPVTVFYTTDQGVQIMRSHTLAARSRLTINIETEAPELANAAVSTRVLSAHTIVSERAMYWGTLGGPWRETHNSFGATATDVKWGLAEGRSGGTRGYQTYVLVATGPFEAQLRVTFLREDNTPIERTYTVGANERFNIDTGGIAELTNWNFSTIVESTNGAPINVESAIYWNVNGVIWESGGNTMGTRLK